MKISVTRLLLLVAIAVLGPVSVAAGEETFRVCADPNSLPFSNDRGEGFENRLAELWAAELGLPVQYTWFPQRRGFLRNTLQAVDPMTGGYKCDVVMGLPVGSERVITTKPYYRSTYALVYVKGRGVDDVHSGTDFVNLDPERRKNLKVGVFTPTPATLWLARNGMHEQMVAYPAMSGDPAAYPGEVVEKDLVSGQLDAAIVWGPIGGYFAGRAKDITLVVIPLRSEPGIRFDFAISAGVRFGDREGKQKLEALIDKTAEKIHTLLEDYNVPLVSEDGSPIDPRS